MALDVIKVRGARQHNLKDIDVEIPRDKYVVITGISGSGKSSLAFDTIYAEGQRRYVESLSAYARQFLGQMDKPDVDYIEGLSPAVSIDQKSRTKNPRSTVGTITEIYDYMRLLFARVGHPHCPKCGKEVTRQSTEQIVDSILSLPEGQRIQVLAPVVKGRKGEYRKVLEDIKREGFVRVRVDGEVRELTDESVLLGRLERYKQHTIDVVVDRLIVKSGIRNRLADSIETALKMGKGVVAVEVLSDSEPQGEAKAAKGRPSAAASRKSREMPFSEHLACATCGISIEEIAPRNFSFNSPYGACEECHGLGYHTVVDPELIVPDGTLSIREGAIAPLAHTQSQYIHAVWRALSEDYDVDLDAPFCTLTEEQMRYVLEGTPDRIWVSFYDRDGDKRSFRMAWRGVMSLLERQMNGSSSETLRDEAALYTSRLPCRKCRGLRLKPESLAVTVKAKGSWPVPGVSTKGQAKGRGRSRRRSRHESRHEYNISEVSSLSIKDALGWFGNVVLTDREATIARQVLKEIQSRLGFLNAVGLDYLTIDRAAATLAGGESQRIRLATQIGSGLMGVLYILDEPSIGLHQRDNRRLIDTLKRMRDLGNTIMVVEHDEETIRSADHIIDIGPGAGDHGGRIVAEGTVEDIVAESRSVTGDYLAGRREIPLPAGRRPGNDACIVVRGAREHNLKKIDVEIPLGRFVCVTGVSGSGKSTLVQETLYPRLMFDLHGTRAVWGKHRGIAGLEHIDKVVDIDQSPIGRTPRSNPATYTKTFDHIRGIFSQTAEARMRGYKPGRFSFNVKGGRCEACRGDGIIKIEMQFLPDVYVPCEVCKGKRYNRETLEVTFKGRNIADVLDMTVEEALGFFENVPRIRRKLQTLHDVGLDYVKLGQPATTLSGGEAQRVKLSSELSRKGTGSTLYILDEPTTGLHFADIEKLLGVLGRLVDAGNTVVVIEHNLDVIKTADYIIDLGPEGGDEGGYVVATGTPEEVARVKGSYTGKFLRTVLGRKSGGASRAAKKQREKIAAAAGS